MVTLQLDTRLLLAPLPDGLTIKTIENHEVLIQLPSRKSVNQILQEEGISFSQAVVAVVNGQTADLDQILRPGDKVHLLPQISGGD